MKKTIVVLLTLFVFVSVKAQVQFGIKAGMNLANLTVSPSTSGLSSLTSFNGGLLASLPISPGLTVQPEVNYSGQGVKESDGSSSGSINLGYINVPVLIKYNHSSGLFAETGPQAGFLISANEKFDGQTNDIKNHTQSFDFSWAFGLGYKLSEIPLGIDVRYNLGLTNVFKSDFADGTTKNSVFQFSLFYLFGGDSK